MRRILVVALLPLLLTGCSANEGSGTRSACATHGSCERTFERSAVAIIQNRFDTQVTGIRCTQIRRGSETLSRCLVRTQPDRCDYWFVRTGHNASAEEVEGQPVGACRKLGLP